MTITKQDFSTRSLLQSSSLQSRTNIFAGSIRGAEKAVGERDRCAAQPTNVFVDVQTESSQKNPVTVSTV